MKRLTKRGILLLLALAVLVVCVACGGGTPAPADNNVGETAQTSEGGETPETDAQTLFNQGSAAFNVGDYDNAVKYWEQAAELEHLDALNNLATLYSDESKGHLNYQKARKYFEKAADMGSAYALFYLGQLYEYGGGVSQDSAKALKYYQQAADKGYEGAAAKVAELTAKLNG